MGSPYTDLERPPLRAESLRRGLVRDGSLWTALEVLDETESTNSEVAARLAGATAHAAEGLVVVAEHQTAGRGRLERTWVSPPRAGLTFSVLLRPAPVAEADWGWLPLLAGLAVAEAIDTVAELPEDAAVTLKWPNDVLVAGHKVAGLLAERRGDAVVVGVGINVTTREAELPVVDGAAPTSLVLAGAAVTDRDTLLRAVLRGLAQRYRQWRAVLGDPAGLLDDYVPRCGTIGEHVVVSLPDGRSLSGTATRVDDTGRLVVSDTDGQETVVASGDVLHVRPGTEG